MYLPNPDLGPTGGEAAEFIDDPPVAERPFGSRPGLDVQTRLNITRWAKDYISGLVDDHDGTPEDVRSIIHALHDQTLTAEADTGF